MAFTVEAVLKQIDALLGMYQHRGARSQHDDLSNLPEAFTTEAITRLSDAIERLAPPDSRHRKNAQAALAASAKAVPLSPARRWTSSLAGRGQDMAIPVEAISRTRLPRWRMLSTRSALTVAIAVVLATALPSWNSAQEKIRSVAIIAHSVSTSMKAREVLLASGWAEVPPKKADYVLVVCRSMLFNPLMPLYRSYCELDKDAENQLNIAGSNFHVYVYRLHDDFSVTQVAHKSFPAD